MQKEDKYRGPNWFCKLIRGTQRKKKLVKSKTYVNSTHCVGAKASPFSEKRLAQLRPEGAQARVARHGASGWAALAGGRAGRISRNRAFADGWRVGHRHPSLLHARPGPPRRDGVPWVGARRRAPRDPRPGRGVRNDGVVSSARWGCSPRSPSNPSRDCSRVQDHRVARPSFQPHLELV